MNDITIVKDKHHGTFVVSHGIVSRLTECCEASAKFMDTGKPGASEVLCCKKCYKPVDEVFADATMIGSEDYWKGLERMMKPCKAIEGNDCAGEVDWLITQALSQKG